MVPLSALKMDVRKLVWGATNLSVFDHPCSHYIALLRSYIVLSCIKCTYYVVLLKRFRYFPHLIATVLSSVNSKLSCKSIQAVVALRNPFSNVLS